MTTANDKNNNNSTNEKKVKTMGRTSLVRTALGGTSSTTTGSTTDRKTIAGNVATTSLSSSSSATATIPTAATTITTRRRRRIRLGTDEERRMIMEDDTVRSSISHHHRQHYQSQHHHHHHHQQQQQQRRKQKGQQQQRRRRYYTITTRIMSVLLYQLVLVRLLILRILPSSLNILSRIIVSAADTENSHINVISNKEKNHLNIVLQYVMNEMNNDNFFIKTWIEYYPMLPIPVPNNCYYGQRIDPAIADESLLPVLQNGILRIGISPLAALYPVIYSRIEDDNSTTTDDDTAKDDTTNHNSTTTNNINDTEASPRNKTVSSNAATTTTATATTKSSTLSHRKSSTATSSLSDHCNKTTRMNDTTSFEDTPGDDIEKNVTSMWDDGTNNSNTSSNSTSGNDTNSTPPETSVFGCAPEPNDMPTKTTTTSTNDTSQTTANNATNEGTKRNNYDVHYTLNLNVATLDGYEIACAREAARRIGLLYGIPMEPVFVVVSDESYFESLRDALNNNIIDMIWSFMYILDYRAEEVDYVCYSYSTEIIVGASAKVGPVRPSVYSSTKIPVPCYAAFCYFHIPEPFYYVDLPNASDINLMNVLINLNDPFEYTISSFEQLEIFYHNYCPNCSNVNMNPIATAYMSPSTKYLPSSNTMKPQRTNDGDTDTINDDDSSITTSSSSAATAASVMPFIIFKTQILTMVVSQSIGWIVSVMLLLSE